MSLLNSSLVPKDPSLQEIMARTAEEASSGQPAFLRQLLLSIQNIVYGVSFALTFER
jgi:hypothetical protein